MEAFEAFTALLQANAWAASTISFLAGGWLGMRLQLALERRKEFNAAALPMRQALRRYIEWPTPYHQPVDAELLDAAEHAAGWLRRWRIRRCLRGLLGAQQQTEPDERGQVAYANPEAASAAARRLYEALRPH